MRSNTTFHPEILSDWPGLTAALKCIMSLSIANSVKVMLWMSSWHLVPVRVIVNSCSDVSRSRDSWVPPSQLGPILGLCSGLGEEQGGLSPPRPNTAQGVIMQTEAQCTVSTVRLLIKWLSIELILSGISPHHHLVVPRMPPMMLLTTIYPRCWPGQAGHSAPCASPLPPDYLSSVGSGQPRDTHQRYVQCT